MEIPRVSYHLQRLFKRQDRSHYVGRTFIEPSQKIRDFGVKLKLAPVAEVLKGKRVVVIDDSIVRGTTSIKIVRLLKEAGATEVHMRIASPPITGSCYYGVDTPSKEELISYRYCVRRVWFLNGTISVQTSLPLWQAVIDKEELG